MVQLCNHTGTALDRSWRKKGRRRKKGTKGDCQGFYKFLKRKLMMENERGSRKLNKFFLLMSTEEDTKYRAELLEK